jgi:hypothetical protein
MTKHIHKLLVSLNEVCVTHAKMNNYYSPSINLNEQEIKKMNHEITKLMNYLKHPQYSYLNK